MSDVAVTAGVSLASVSRALRRPESVSEEVSKRVHAAAEKLGYSANPIASSMSGTSSSIIAVLVPTLTNAFFSQSIQSMAAELEGSAYQMMIGVHEYDDDREANMIQAFLNWKPAALVVTGVHHNKRSNKLLINADCPVIEIWDLDRRPIDTVIGFSNTEVGRATAAHLIESGRRNLVYVGHLLDRDPRANARALAFVDEAQRSSGVTGRIVPSPDRTSAAGFEIIQTVLRDYPQTDGIAFSGDGAALGALKGAAAAGARVPEDIAVIGFGDLDPSGYSTPALTTVRPPHSRIGRAVAKHVLSQLSNPKEIGEIIDLGFQLIKRSST